MRKHLLLLTSIFFLATSAYAQIKYKGLPQDLDKETLVFVKFDQLQVPEGKTKVWQDKRADRFIANHNAVSGTSNQQLEEAVKEYPFKYKIIYYSELASLQNTDYKYVLIFEPVETLYEEGTYITGNSSPLMIKDIKSGDSYKLKNFNSSFIYYYKGLINHLNKRVKKSYNI